MATPFAQATTVRPETSHTYSANFPTDWCIGSVPHGGFVTSCFMRVAALHFASTHRKQNQPHTITVHLEFLRRTEVGPALFTVRDVKLGRQTSTIHVTLTQQVDGDRRHEVEGYITNTNIHTEQGPSFSTHWSLTPAPPPGSPSRFSLASSGVVQDPNDKWEESPPLPHANFRKATNRVRFLFPKGGQTIRACCDQWVALSSGERFTNESLGFVCDIFPQLIDALVASDGPSSSSQSTMENKSAARYWYPTVLLNLDVKKALPDDGVPWLFVRLRAKTIKNGRYDIEIIIMDEDAQVIALSHHVALVVDAKRNLKARNGRQEKRGDGAAKI